MVVASLALVGQPIFANDTWIHLALGEAFLASGPWLSVDPHLFAAPGPPSPSSWLGSLALYAVYEVVGFQGLRLFHVALVAGLFGLVWRVGRRATRSPELASAGLVLFILLSTYRIVQLRPHLMTIGAVLAIYLLVIAPRAGPGRVSMGVAGALTLIWANVHAAFLLGPLLVLGVSASLFALSALPGTAPPGSERSRASRIGVAGAAMSLASLANPRGWGAHLAYFSAGQETLPLDAILDEWGRTNLLAWPADRLPPTPAAWWVTWLCVIAIGVGAMSLLSLMRRGAAGGSECSSAPIRIDPALFALSVASVGAALLASRFLWMGVFPLLLLGGVLFGRAPDTVTRASWIRWGLVAGVIAASSTHFMIGDWPLVSRVLRAPAASYLEPYRAEKYFGHSMWFLADSEVQGRIFNDYRLGGFMSFWLSPKLQMASSGTMNVERGAMEAQLAIAARQRARDDETFGELLDRQGFDLFLGTGLPVAGPASRPVVSTVQHLENEPGWIQVFRSLRSGVFLRESDRNNENLDRIAEYYEAAGVPFDRVAGFDPELVILRAPEWAKEHGLIPVDFEARLTAARDGLARNQVTPAAESLAMLYAVLGSYDRALMLDRAILGVDRSRAGAAQRVIWSLLHQNRDREALELAHQFDGRPSGPAQPGGWAASVELYLDPARGDRSEKLAQLPLMSAGEGRWIQQGVILPRARTSRSR